MILEELQIRSTGYYYLINQRLRFSLYVEPETKSSKQKNHLVKVDEERLEQIWQIIKIADEAKTNHYEIVHLRSTFVLTKIRGGEAKLKYGKMSNSQLFQIKSISGSKGLFHFVCIEDKKSMLCFSQNELKIIETDPLNEESQWSIVPCLSNPEINESCYFENSLTQLSMDVPKASLDKGCEIISYKFNNRFNQRFKILNKEDNFVSICNLNSNLFLSCHKKCREGDKITQESENENESRQKWKLEYEGRGLFFIRSKQNPNMLLGCKNQNLMGGSLITTANEDLSMWKIVGFIPEDD